MNKKTYKIGIDARMYGPKQTGIGNYIRHLLNNLAEIDRHNRYVVFLLDKEFDGFKLPADNFQKIKVSARWYSWSEQAKLPWQFMQEKLDLMHFPHFNSPIFYRGKTIVTIHDVTPLFFPGHKMGSLLRRKAFGAVFYHSVNYASKIIAVSESTKRDIAQYFRIKPEKIRVIYEGVEAEKFSIEEGRQLSDKIAELKAKYDITKPFILYTGVWRNHKNLVGLIRAFNLLLEKHKLDYELVMGGEENPYYPEIRECWESLGIGSSIIRPGFIISSELPLFYKAASATVIPSFYEGFGLVGLEAMAAGSPVVASNCTALPEVLGRAALYFDPKDPDDMAKKIKMILTEDPLRDRLVKEGNELIKKYDWRKMAEETLHAYNEILEKN